MAVLTWQRCNRLNLQAFGPFEQPLGRFLKCLMDVPVGQMRTPLPNIRHKHSSAADIFEMQGSLLYLHGLLLATPSASGRPKLLALLNPSRLSAELR